MRPCLSIERSVRQSICLSVPPSVPLSVWPSVHMTVCPSVHPSVRPSIRPSVRPSVRPSIHPSVRPSVRPSIRPSVHPSVRPSVRLSVHLSESDIFVQTNLFSTIYHTFFYPTWKVYSGSKLFLWRSYFHAGSALNLLADLNTRICGSDTDSWILSLSHQRTSFQTHELRQQTLNLAKNMETCLYTQSSLFKDMAYSFLRAFLEFLDFSSILVGSPLYVMIVNNHPHNETLLTFLASLTKNKSLYFKDECSYPLQNFYGTSPKQYMLTYLPTDARYNSISLKPTNKKHVPHDICTEACVKDLELIPKTVLKAKGIKRNIAGKVLNNISFARVTQRRCNPIRVSQYSLKRQDRRIFLIQTKKRSLSCLNTKQYFNSLYETDRNFFGFPLYLKQLLES